jgi:hypothetical protein
VALGRNRRPLVVHSVRACRSTKARTDGRRMDGGRRHPDVVERRERWNEVPLVRRGIHHSNTENQGRASYTRLNGVSATLRKVLKPAARTTAPILSSPAWLPSASRAPSETACGTHRNVENE